MFTLRFQSFTTDKARSAGSQAIVQPILAAKGEIFRPSPGYTNSCPLPDAACHAAQATWLNASFHQRAPEIGRFSLGSAIS